jgi:DegV family protein with EDD domain
MADYRIVTESTADLTPELVMRYDISVIPMSFAVDDVAYLNFPDNRELAPREFYDRLRAGGSSTTTAVNPAQFEEIFVPILESGQDILYVAFSSGLSSTYANSLLTIQELKTRFPDRRILAVDTLAASMGEGLLACLAAEKKAAGGSLDEVAQWLLDNRLRMVQWFTVDDLIHLHRGGRVGALSAHVGTALGIKPVLHVDNEGRLIPILKVRGRKQSLDALADKMGALGENLTEQMIFISHGDALETTQEFAEQLKQRFGVREVQLGIIGPVVGSHSGPGAVALFFLGGSR